MPEAVVRGARIHYQRLGHGPRRVVFLHGFVWDNLSSWYFTAAPAVAPLAEVLLWDLRGHGRSERTASGYRVEDMVADLAALLADQGWNDRPVHLVGNSYGGLLAVAFAAAHPQAVASLVLVDSNLSDERWASEMTAILEAGGREQDRLITETFRQWAGRHRHVESTRMAQTARRLLDETTLVADLDASPPITDDELRAIGCPVLALYGESSDLRSRGERLAEMLPDCRIHFIPGGSHVILWEATAAVRDHIVHWLEGRE